MMILFSEKCNN